ncbi:MAG: 3-isopropylmalate dehydrogenase [Alphaproteobacteria bacterium]|nr:3-isopropylmalate dehydrogenase [Alphaproteobacteria bacterium]
MAALRILLLPGDGIGPEIMRETRRLLDWFSRKRKLSFELSEGLVGGAAYDGEGAPVSDATLARARAVDAVLMVSVGGTKWDNVPRALRPEAGLLRLRKELDLFANLRPAIVFDALVDASTLRPEIVRGLDILIVRELTGGVYFGQPRGRETLSDGTERALDTQVYTRPEIERIARVAFELARKRRNKVTSVEKANVMESGAFWRAVVTPLAKAEYPDVTLEHLYADNCAMQLVRNPRQFDVIVTDNLFGDLLSDEAAMLTGSLGMLPSASLGAPDAKTGKRLSLYEPVHGSAPDIAGQNKANPLATFLTVAMMFRYSLDLGKDAERLEAAVKSALESGARTGDIMQPGKTLVSTTGMTDAVLKALDQAL